MTWFLSVFLLTQSFSCESCSQCHSPPPFYLELIRFFCLLSVSSPVYLITRPGSLMLIDPLWEKQETLYTKSFKSSQIKTELIYTSGEIWNWSLLSWGSSTSCRKVNLGHFLIPCMMSNCSCEWIQIKAWRKCRASQSSERVLHLRLQTSQSLLDLGLSRLKMLT